MRDYMKALDAVSTSFRGYNKEEMMLYIKKLLQSCDEDKMESLDKLIEQSDSLRKELEESRKREDMLRSQYDALLERFEKLSETVSQTAKYSALRDAQLDEFHRKQDEIENLLTAAREEAAKEKESLLADAREECHKLLELAEEKRKQKMARADEYLLVVREKAEEENRKAQEKTQILEDELAQMAERLKPILFPEEAMAEPDQDSRSDDN